MPRSAQGRPPRGANTQNNQHKRCAISVTRQGGLLIGKRPSHKQHLKPPTRQALHCSCTYPCWERPHDNAWRCRCDGGIEANVGGYGLGAGRVTSCLQRAAERNERNFGILVGEGSRRTHGSFGRFLPAEPGVRPVARSCNPALPDLCSAVFEPRRLPTRLSRDSALPALILRG
jgi:hypothetical protein